MKICIIIGLILTLLVSMSLAANPFPYKIKKFIPGSSEHLSGSASPDKAAPPFYLMGGPSSLSGKFETALGIPDPQGWVGVDLTNAFGDFAKVWDDLIHKDLCYDNDTPQFAFVDDGTVSCPPTLPGTPYLSFWGLNFTGGCDPMDGHLHNEIWSPALTWPGPPYTGAEFSYDVYADMPMENGFFYIWSIRSKTSSGAWSEWRNDNYAYIGSGGYQRDSHDVTDLLVPDVDQIQLSLGVVDLSYLFGFSGGSSTSSPYFDNVDLVAYDYDGPVITVDESDLAQDSFPACGSITYGTTPDIRFDIADDIIGDADPQIVPGDTIVASIKSRRYGAELNPLNPPKMYWTMHQNPTFSPLGGFRSNAEFGAASNGIVVGIPVGDDLYGFDLPDADFFYPGDVIHYYIWAEDIVQSSGLTARSTLPADRFGYGIFTNTTMPFKLYDSSFEVHGLPTLNDSGEGSYYQPNLLFWNDFANLGGENEWYFALSQLGAHRYERYDVYYTNAPASGVSNGLGARAAATQLAGYDCILYTSGYLDRFTLADYDQNQDKSNDILLIDLWLAQGDKLLFITGNKILTDLSTTTDGSGIAFMNKWIGVNYVDGDVSDVIGNRLAPLVNSTHSLINLPRDFIAYGACPSQYTFDEFTLGDGTVSLANYSDTTIPAVSCRYDAGVNSMVVYSSVDFSFWYTPANDSFPLSSRAENLHAIMEYFYGYFPKGDEPTDAPASIAFSASNHPNPFNPTTRIEFSVPKACDVSVKIYNARGELVRTLVDEPMEASDRVARNWDGTDNKGIPVASGVYFYRTRAGDYSTIRKMALIK